MSKRKDSDNKDSDKAAVTESPAATAATEATPAPPEPQISLSLPEPVPAELLPPSTLVIETSKPADMPKPVEAVLKAVEAMKPPVAPAAKPDDAPAPAAARAEQVASASKEARSNRFALLAASVALAGAFGAMAGALATSALTRPSAPAQTGLAAAELAPMQKSIANLRSELTAIKNSVESGSRNTSAQFAKFTERLERIDRAQAVPAAQLKQAIDAIERLERRAQTGTHAAAEMTGSVRPQTVAVPPPPEPQRPQVLDGWVVRRVSHGAALIQGRRIGLIEVETGDVVPGVGRIESIRRQEGRWVVVTSKGLIRSVGLNAPPMR